MEELAVWIIFWLEEEEFEEAEESTLLTGVVLASTETVAILEASESAIVAADWSEGALETVLFTDDIVLSLMFCCSALDLFSGISLCRGLEDLVLSPTEASSTEAVGVLLVCKK